MTLTQFPIAPGFVDDFVDGDLATDWATTGDGTVAETGGVLRCAVAAGQFALATLWHATTLRGAMTATVDATIGTPTAGRVSAGLSLAGAGGAPAAIYWHVEHDGTGLYLRARQGATVVSESFAGGAVTLAIRRLSRTTVVCGVVTAGEFVTKATFSAFAETGALFGLLVASTGDGTVTADFDDAEFDSDETQIDAVDLFVCGQHLAATVKVFGSGFQSTATAEWTGPTGAETCAVTVNDDGTVATIVAPVQTIEGAATVTLRPYEYGPPLTVSGFVISGRGYRILRSLLPPDRYVVDPTNLFNVFLAAYGRQLDIIESSRRALVETELHPQRAVVLLHRWERIFGIAPNPQDSVAVRQARLDLRRRVDPRISVEYINGLIAAVLPGVTLTENEDFDTFENGAYQYQIYEPATGTLDPSTVADLLSLLRGAGPAWTRPRVGALGFTIGASAVSRDFLQ